MVEADPGAVVGLGLRRPLSREELGRLVAAHDSAALVDAVHTRAVRPGDGVLVPAGTAHFIGEGILVTELQEPTDLSILLEWEGFAVDGDATAPRARLRPRPRGTRPDRVVRRRRRTLVVRHGAVAPAGRPGPCRTPPCRTS